MIILLNELTRNHSGIFGRVLVPKHIHECKTETDIYGNTVYAHFQKTIITKKKCNPILNFFGLLRFDKNDYSAIHEWKGDKDAIAHIKERSNP